MVKESRNIPETNPSAGFKSATGNPPFHWKPSIFTALPLPLFIGMVTLFDIILPPTPQFSRALAFEPPYLNAVLYTVFLFFTSYLVAYVSLKSYLQTGMTFLVLLGSGTLAWGSVSLLAGWMTNLPSGPNPAITISNTGALLAGALHLASSIGATGGTKQNRPSLRKPILGIFYGGVLLSTAVLTLASLEGLTPAFFILGVGQTLLRMIVLASAAAMFGVSALLFTRLYLSSESASSILYWYILALALTGVGLAAVFFGRAPGDPISWTGRAAMFLGGVYFLKAVRSSFKGGV